MTAILVPTDFSKTAYNALKYAFGLAEATHSNIIILHVFTIPTADINIPFTGIYNSRHEVVQGAQKEMNKLVKIFHAAYPGIKIKTVLSAGLASPAITEYITTRKIKLAIMGTTGLGAITRALIGSTTSSVIRNTSCNVIAVPPRIKFNGLSKIAVATDLQNDNLSCLKDVVGLSKKNGSTIMFVYVQSLQEFTEKDKYEEMADLVRQRTNYRNISFHIVRDSNLEHGLDSFVRKNKPGILAMATHKRKFPGSIWSASLSRRMSYHTSIPIMILHLPANMKAHD